MTCKIITEKPIVEKMADDVFFSDDNMPPYLDYADLCAIRRFSSLKYVVSIMGCYSEENAADEILKSVKTLPNSNLKSYLLQICANEADLQLRREYVQNMIKVVDIIKDDLCSEVRLDGLYTLAVNPSIPAGEWQVNLILGVDKTEDEK